MQVELSKNEVDLIEEALDAWEKEAGSGALIGSMMGLMLCPKDERDTESKRREKELEVAQCETKLRKTKAVLLRAKLIQAMSRDSEYTLQ